MEHTVTLFCLMALSFGLLLFTVGSGKPSNASDAAEDSNASSYSLDGRRSKVKKSVHAEIPSGQLL